VNQTPVPDHSTLSRRAETLRVPRPRSSREPVHLLVDSTGLKLCGPGEWLVAMHGTRTRRSWRKLHLGVDADTGEIMAGGLTANDDDDGAQVGPLLDQVTRPNGSTGMYRCYSPSKRQRDTGSRREGGSNRCE